LYRSAYCIPIFYYQSWSEQLFFVQVNHILFSFISILLDNLRLEIFRDVNPKSRRERLVEKFSQLWNWFTLAFTLSLASSPRLARERRNDNWVTIRRVHAISYQASVSNYLRKLLRNPRYSRRKARGSASSVNTLRVEARSFPCRYNMTSYSNNSHYGRWPVHDVETWRKEFHSWNFANTTLMFHSCARTRYREKERERERERERESAEGEGREREKAEKERKRTLYKAGT